MSFKTILHLLSYFVLVCPLNLIAQQPRTEYVTEESFENVLLPLDKMSLKNKKNEEKKRKILHLL